MNEQHFLAIILLSLILGANAFNYKDAKNWGEKYPKCNGKNQSPIDMKSYPIIPREFPKGLKKLKLTDFDKLPTKVSIKNTGHTVELRADYSGKPPKISSGNLHGIYVFEKITFHWAKKRVGPVMDGVTFDDLANNLKKVESINSTTDIPPFVITGAVDPVPAYLFYKGSLDYPPCSESVTWFLYDSEVFITADLLNGLRKVKLSEGDVSNFRPAQPINNRQIKTMMTE
ncbi:carbonic anhydrase 7-like [Belonocnema kinseyi]|uniref:carbonic anhydrase 7-like n=1 Tax=Belonocnema kinseyi TaxID=2817044 RepID=UPI00143D87F2|nr:carbonic anhydrase 7-like [Belonocnema kinseyi]